MLFFVRIPEWVYFGVYILSCTAIGVYAEQATTGLGSNASLNSGVWKLRRLAKGLRYRCA